MFEAILGLILVLILLTIIVFTSIKTDMKCPDCGTTMIYLGDDNTMGFPNGLPQPLKHHYYICPKCGKNVVI